MYHIDLVFKNEANTSTMLLLDEECFGYSFLCDAKIKQALEEGELLCFEFYTLGQFSQERRYRDEYRSYERSQ